MHQDIKRVISTIRLYPADHRVSVSFTSWQHTDMGYLLSILYYRMSTALLDMVDAAGYPHNGGQHTLTVYGSALDVIAFIELWKEELEKFRMVDSRLECRSQLSYISQELHGQRSVARKAGYTV